MNKRGNRELLSTPLWEETIKAKGATGGSNGSELVFVGVKNTSKMKDYTTKSEGLKAPESVIARISSINEHLEETKGLLNVAKAEVQRIEDQRKGLVAVRHKTEQSLSVLSPYKVGDKVTVHKCYLEGGTRLGSWMPRNGIISKVMVRIMKSYALEFEYKINKVKKDGSMSEMAIRYKADTYQESEFSTTK